MWKLGIRNQGISLVYRAIYMVPTSRAPAQNSRRHPSELCWRSTRSLAENHQFAQVDDARFMEDDHVEEGGSKLQQQNAGYDIEINTDHQ